MKTPKKLRRTLTVSFMDGACAAVMQGLTEQFIIPFALALKATNTQIGLLTSIPNLFASLMQLKTPDILENLGNRLSLVTKTVFLHAVMWLPIFSIPYLFPAHPIPFLIFFYALCVVSNSFGSSAWASMMSDLIPRGRRGKYFGWRNKYMSLITVTSALGAGFILHRLHQNILVGFSIVFFLAFVFRMLSWSFLRQMHEPPLKLGKEHRFTFKQFVGRFPKSNFTRFVFYCAGISFFTNIAAPFFSVYMLKQLHMSYPVYTIIMVTSTLAGLFSMPYWGHLIDHVGSIRVIRFLSPLIPLAPILWLFSGNFFYLIGVQIFSGYAWSGYNLSVGNFIYDTTTSEKRARCLAYFNAVTGTAVCVGAFLGGLLATHLPRLWGSRLLTLFLLSGLLRAVINMGVLPTVREARTVAPMSRKDLFLRFWGVVRRTNI